MSHVIGGPVPEGALVHAVAEANGGHDEGDGAETNVGELGPVAAQLASELVRVE